MTGPDRPPRSLSILVVDDAADAADSLAMLLGLYGHTVRVARNGEDALRQVAVDSPDVVFLDVRMPGLDGYEVARRLREQTTRNSPFLVAVTGCATEDDRLRSAEAGIHLHLAKPADPDVLVGLLWRFARMLSPTAPADGSVSWHDGHGQGTPPDGGRV